MNTLANKSSLIFPRIYKKNFAYIFFLKMDKSLKVNLKY